MDRARLIAFLMVLTTAVAGCGDDATGDKPKRSETALEALVRSVKFERGIPASGDIATFDPSVGSISLTPTDSEIDLSAGIASLIGFEVEGLEEDQEVSATLLQFEGADSHVRVPVDADAGPSSDTPRIENPFHVDDDVCEYLCNRVFTVQLSFAVEIDGEVTRERTIDIVLDCREDGDEALCEGGDGDGDGDGDGNGDGDGDGDGDAGIDAGGNVTDGGMAEQPIISALTPMTLPAGEAATIAISGSNFAPGAKVFLNGVEVETTVVSDMLIEIEVPESLTLAGSLSVVVQNAPGDPTSSGNVLYVQVTPPPGAPVVYDYSPDNGVPGDTILIIATNLAGQTLTIEDAEGNELEPGEIGTISWPAGTADTVEIVLPDDMATGPITVSNPLGSYRGKIFSVGENLTRAEGTVITSSTEYNSTNWGRASGADNQLRTSFFTAVGDCATLTSCTTVPWYMITLAEDQLIGRIAMRGNREYASGYDFIRGTFKLLDASDDVVWEGTYELPPPDRDIDITLPEPVEARALRFESLEDESSEPGFSELELFGP